MSRAVLGSIASTVPSRLGECEVGLLALREPTPGPVLTFSVGWEFVSVWNRQHCCAVLDRALLRLSLPIGVVTGWTVDELTWWSSSATNAVMVGLSDRRPLPGAADAGTQEPTWWRLEPAGLALLREQV